MKFGVTTHTGQCRLAELIDYPIPLLLDYDDCQKYIDKYYPNEKRYHPKIESERTVWALVKMMVEVHSGRRKVSNGNMVVVNEARPTYEQLYLWSCDGKFSGISWKDREAAAQARLMLYRESIRKTVEMGNLSRRPKRPPMIRRE